MGAGWHQVIDDVESNAVERLSARALRLVSWLAAVAALMGMIALIGLSVAWRANTTADHAINTAEASRQRASQRVTSLEQQIAKLEGELVAIAKERG
jgi:TolA-binding protein